MLVSLADNPARSFCRIGDDFEMLAHCWSFQQPSRIGGVLGLFGLRSQGLPARSMSALALQTERAHVFLAQKKIETALILREDRVPTVR
jgi:hypothetical protein